MERDDQIATLFKATIKLDSLIGNHDVANGSCTLDELRADANQDLLDLWDQDIALGLLDLYEAAHEYVDFARQQVRAGWQPGDSTS